MLSLKCGADYHFSVSFRTMEVAEENGSTKDEYKKKTEFYCKICDKYYASYKSFGNHTRSYHGSNKEKAQCNFCGNCFTRKDNLQQHIRLFHSSVQAKFSCKFCPEKFESRTSLTKHKQNCSKKSSLNVSNQEKFEVKTIVLYTPTPANTVQMTLPNSNQTNIKSSESEAHDLEPRKKRRRKPSRTFYLNDANNNEIESYEPDALKDDKALDCNVCNITFLSEKDYLSHKPFCEEGNF